VSRTRRKVKGDWDPWNSRSLAGERLILDGTVVRVRPQGDLDLAALGVRADGQKFYSRRHLGRSFGLRCTVHKHSNLPSHAPEGARRDHRRLP
jgi:hypothetical protein